MPAKNCFFFILLSYFNKLTWNFPQRTIPNHYQLSCFLCATYQNAHLNPATSFRKNFWPSFWLKHVLWFRKVGWWNGEVRRYHFKKQDIKLNFNYTEFIVLYDIHCWGIIKYFLLDLQTSCSCISLVSLYAHFLFNYPKRKEKREKILGRCFERMVGIKYEIVDELKWSGSFIHKCVRMMTEKYIEECFWKYLCVEFFFLLPQNDVYICPLKCFFMLCLESEGVLMGFVFCSD